MSGNIHFGEAYGQSWIVAGWFFRLLLTTVVEAHPEDPEMLEAIRLASEVGFLFVNDLQPALKERMTLAIQEAVVKLIEAPFEEGNLEIQTILARILAGVACCFKALGERSRHFQSRNLQHSFVRHSIRQTYGFVSFSVLTPREGVRHMSVNKADTNRLSEQKHDAVNVLL